MKSFWGRPLLSVLLLSSLLTWNGCGDSENQGEAEGEGSCPWGFLPIHLDDCTWPMEDCRDPCLGDACSSNICEAASIMHSVFVGCIVPQYASCQEDGECVLVEPLLTCSHSDSTKNVHLNCCPVPVAETMKDDFLAALRDIEDTFFCKGWADGCTATPTCEATVPRCVEGACSAVVATQE